MPRIKRFIETDVLTEARRRLRDIYDRFDSVAVNFSGGKDSLVVLHLAHEVAQERGLPQVDVVFRDEELIPDMVIDFVNSYRVLPWVRMHYFAIPLRSQKYILGRSFDYIQWDPDREHIRPIPAHAITTGDRRVFDQYTADSFIGERFQGCTAFLLGMRAQESLMRYRGFMMNMKETYICHPRKTAPRVSLCNPIYDWTEDDVFKYFYDHQVRYCEIYDGQHLAGSNLRVSTPLHAESAKRLGLLRAVAPVFYNQVLKLFPECAVQDRYYDQLDQDKIRAKYGQSFEGIRAWIDENVTDPEQHEKSIATLAGAMRGHELHPDDYPPQYVFKHFMGGGFKRKLLPLTKGKANVR